MQRLLFLFVISLLAPLVFILPAHAYLDAGTGSMILQLLIAGVAGALVMIKVYWYKLKRLFTRDHGLQDQNGEEDGS